MESGAMNASVTSPLVSVIIPTRDRLPFLKEAVQTVMTQTLFSSEAVVVDDASSDGTAEWLAGQDSERLATVVLQKHVERAVARNRGLEKARGEFVLFLDDDDRLRSSALTTLRSALTNNPDAIGAVGARVLFNERGQQRKLPHPRRSFSRLVWTDLLAGWMSPPGTVLWRAEAIRTAGGWNEGVTVSGDYELWLRVSRRGPLVFMPDVVLEKRTHSGQWRAVEIREIHEKWKRELIDGLPREDRELALRLSRTYRLLNDARIAYGEMKNRESLLLFWNACRTAPRVMRSPLLRPMIARGVVKSFASLLAGRRGRLMARQARAAIRRARGRDVEEVKQRTSIRSGSESP